MISFRKKIVMLCQHKEWSYKSDTEKLGGQAVLFGIKQLLDSLLDSKENN